MRGGGSASTILDPIIYPAGYLLRRGRVISTDRGHHC
jgi:hypothetical protein